LLQEPNSRGSRAALSGECQETGNVWNGLTSGKGNCTLHGTCLCNYSVFWQSDEILYLSADDAVQIAVNYELARKLLELMSASYPRLPLTGVFAALCSKSGSINIL